MCALQQERMATRPESVRDVLIGQDAGVAKARRIMSQALAAETPANAT